MEIVQSGMLSAETFGKGLRRPEKGRTIGKYAKLRPVRTFINVGGALNMPKITVFISS